MLIIWNSWLLSRSKLSRMPNKDWYPNSLWRRGRWCWRTNNMISCVFVTTWLVYRLMHILFLKNEMRNWTKRVKNDCHCHFINNPPSSRQGCTHSRSENGHPGCHSCYIWDESVYTRVIEHPFPMASYWVLWLLLQSSCCFSDIRDTT